jgi:hypothetical protein
LHSEIPSAKECRHDQCWQQHSAAAGTPPAHHTPQPAISRRNVFHAKVRSMGWQTSVLQYTASVTCHNWRQQVLAAHHTLQQFLNTSTSTLPTCRRTSSSTAGASDATISHVSSYTFPGTTHRILEQHCHHAAHLPSNELQHRRRHAWPLPDAAVM